MDASKAPGYRGGGGGGGGCSPCSRTSSHGSTPPPAYAPPMSGTAYQAPLPLTAQLEHMSLTPHASHVSHVSHASHAPHTQHAPHGTHARASHNIMVSMASGVSMSPASLGLGYVGVEPVSRLNPRAPDFAQRHPLMQHKHNAQVNNITYSGLCGILAL